MTNFKKLAMLCTALLATTSLAFATGCNLFVPNTSESASNSESTAPNTSESASNSESTAPVEPEILDLGVTYEVVNLENATLNVVPNAEEAATLTLNLTAGNYYIVCDTPADAGETATIEVGPYSYWLDTTAVTFEVYEDGETSLFVKYTETYEEGVTAPETVTVSYKLYKINTVELTAMEGKATLLSNVFTKIHFSVEEPGLYTLSSSNTELIIGEYTDSTIKSNSYTIEATECDVTLYVSSISIIESYEFDWKIEVCPPVEVEDGDMVTLKKNQDVEIKLDCDENKAYKIEIETDNMNVNLKYWNATWEQYIFASSLIYEFDGNNDTFRLYYSSWEETDPVSIEVKIRISEVGMAGDRTEAFDLTLGETNTFVVMTSGREASAYMEANTYSIVWDNANVIVTLNGVALTSGVNFDYTPATNEDDEELDPVFAFTVADGVTTTQTVNLQIKKYYPTISLGQENAVTIDPATASNIYGFSYVEVEFVAPAAGKYEFTVNNNAMFGKIGRNGPEGVSAQYFEEGESDIFCVLIRNLQIETTFNVTVAEKQPLVIGQPYTESVNGFGFAVIEVTANESGIYTLTTDIGADIFTSDPMFDYEAMPLTGTIELVANETVTLYIAPLNWETSVTITITKAE